MAGETEHQCELRSTKIVATLGPASDIVIAPLISAGVDVFRLNFSHGDQRDHEKRISEIRQAARKQDRHVAILGDLQGPKIRIGGFAGRKSINLHPGAEFCIDVSRGLEDGDEAAVGSAYTDLITDVEPGDRLVLGDGLLELKVKEVDDPRIHCLVTMGGELDAGKGINMRGGGLSAPALTEKDLEDLAFACRNDLDYVAVSFVQSAADLRQVRKLISGHGAACGIVAKLERAEAVASVSNIDEIIVESDAVMVARGDLGIEIGDAALMGMQKQIIGRCRELSRCVITATQMMETMVTNPQPTRAEVMDVANAVLDGTDAVMLSAETAVGRYPVETVRSMDRVIRGAESSSYVAPPAQPGYSCSDIDESVALASMTVAENLSDVTAVACLTATGKTPKLMSRSRSRLPIYALADNPRTLAQVALFRGVHPRLFETEGVDYAVINEAAVSRLVRDGSVRPGERVILSKGDYQNVQGGTNTLKIMEVS